MTPLELQLEGFTCYRQRVTVDWRAQGTGLFAVTGPTGAGKSTLLDAITYALYGQTPRLGGRGLESLVSPGAAGMHVQLTFRAARGVFRVTRAVQRKASGLLSEVRVEEADKGAAHHDGWRQLPASERVRDANKAVEEIVGLDYAGFTRAVLLPQGAFDEFLRGDAGERRRLLVTLLGLDKVEEVRELAGRVGREADGLAKSLQARLGEDYADVSAGAVRDLEERRGALKAEAARVEAELAGLESTLALALERARLERTLADLGARRSRLEEEAGRVAASAAELEAARKAAVLAPAFVLVEERAGRVRELTEAVEKAGAAAAARREAATAAAAVEAARRSELDARLPALEAELAALVAAAAPLATLARNGGDLGLAARAKEAELLDEAAWARLSVAEGQLSGLERAERDEAAAGERLGAAERERAVAVVEAERLAGELERRAALGKELKERAELRDAELRAALRAHAAAAVRAHVHVGEDCPVCGNRIEALAQGGGDAELAAADAAHKVAKEALERARSDYLELKGRLEGAKARLEGAAKAAAAAAEQAAAAGAAATAAAKALAGLLGGERGDLLGGGRGERAGAAELRSRLAEARSAALAAHAKAVADDLKAGGVAAGRLAVVGAAARQAELVREADSLRSALEAAKTAHAAASRAAETAGLELEGARARLGEVTAERDEAAARLSEAVAASGFGGLEEARAAARSEADMARLAREVDDHRQERGAVERSAAEAQAALAAQPPLPDPEGLGAAVLAARLGERLQEARRKRTEAVAELATTSHKLETAKERLARKRELTAQLAEASARAELHKQLATDLRSDRFQEYLMTRVQQRLARRASAIVRNVTDGRFDLHLLDGDYLVADAWAGGHLRSARTLSGGESFVASLALALALSDTLAGNASLGALFLDEGFGTLDRDTLEAVTGVLGSLSDEGRMVGVITHVTELSERLPARLVVTKGQGGSVVAWDE